MTLSNTELQKALSICGWPIAVDGVVGPQTTQAIKDFQRGWVNDVLVVDGIVSPDGPTEAALRQSVQFGGHITANFAWREFASKGNGWIKVARELVSGLEALRTITGPIGIVDGYRDPAHNSATGGAATDSQHLYGNAADPGAIANYQLVRSLRRFSGIGINSYSGRVSHVDVRHVGPNTTNSTVDNPAIWYYNRY